MPVNPNASQSAEDESKIDVESLLKLDDFVNIAKIENIRIPDKTELRNLKNDFGTTKINIKNTITNAETLMNYMSDIVARTITFPETISIDEFRSRSWKMKYDEPVKERIFPRDRTEGSGVTSSSFYDEIRKLSVEYEVLFTLIEDDKKITNSELCKIKNTDVAFSNFVMHSPRENKFDEKRRQFNLLTDVVESNKKMFKDVEGTLSDAIADQTNNTNTSKTDENISVLESARSNLIQISDTTKKGSAHRKAIFAEFYNVMQFIKDFIKHDRAMLYLFFMYRVGKDNALFEKLFLETSISGTAVNDLIDEVFNYGNETNIRSADGDMTPAEAKKIAENKSKMLSRWKNQNDSDLGVDVDGLLRQKIKNTLMDIQVLKSEHFESVDQQKAAVIIIRTMLTSRGDFNLFNFVYMKNSYGEASNREKNEFTQGDGMNKGVGIGLGAVAVAAVAITTAVTASAGLATAVMIATVLAGPIVAAVVVATYAAIAIGSIVGWLVGRNDDDEFKAKIANTMYSVERKKLKVDEGYKGLNDPVRRFKLVKHTAAVNDFSSVFCGEDSSKIGYWYGVPNRNDLFAMTFHRQILMYVKEQKLILLTRRMSNYITAIKAIRDIADAFDTTENFTTFREILGEDGKNLIYCKNRLSDLSRGSKYDFINNRQTLSSASEILGIDTMFSRTSLLKENSNENLKI
jgi:hypothetical protein